MVTIEYSIYKMSKMNVIIARDYDSYGDINHKSVNCNYDIILLYTFSLVFIKFRK